MIKRLISALLVVLLYIPTLGSVSTSTIYAGSTVRAEYSQHDVYINDSRVYLRGFNILNNNYYGLRDIAKAFSGTSSQFNVVWNQQKNAIEILTGQSYNTEDQDDMGYFSNYNAVLSTSKLLINGKPVHIKAYTVNNRNYFQLRDLASKIPFELQYDAKKNNIQLYSVVPDHAYRVKLKGEQSNNHNLESPLFPRWKETVTSYLVNNSDGTISAINAGEKLKIETYNGKFEPISSKTIAYELPIFGGYYSGNTYNYIAFGQTNHEENDNKEVIRIVRYDKNFKRVDSVSIKGGKAYTVIPFDAAAGRMAEQGDTLVFHTSRERYMTEDGLNHQSQLTIMINTNSMTVMNDLGKFQSNHVSHSFDQYVLFDGTSHVLVDHGDAYPRTIALQKGDGTRYDMASMFDIPGATGANATGVSIGGFEISANNYIVALNTIDHSLVKQYTSFELVGLKEDQRDIMLSVLPKNSSDNGTAQHITLAKYVGTKHIASIPKLVKITDDKFMVLWQEFDKTSYQIGDLKYVYVNGNGQIVGSIKTIKHFELSECNPIVAGNNVIWFTNNSRSRMFYRIPVQ